MKMDTVWQAKVADSAIKIGTIWMWRVHLAIGIGLLLQWALRPN